MAETEVVWKGNEALRPLLVAVIDLRPHPGNPRRHDLDAVAASLNRFGQQRPVLARDGQLIAGHGTTMAAASKLGWTHIAVLPSDLSSEADIRDFLLADNRTADLGHYDLAQLAAMLAAAADEGTLEGTGYSGEDADQVLAELTRLGEQQPPPGDGDQQPPSRPGGDGGSDVREIVLMLTAEQFEKFTASIRMLRREYGTEGVIETAYEAVVRAAQAL